MAFNGSGVFNITTAGQPVVTDTTITSTAFNLLTNDLANGLSNVICHDGQTTTTASIPFVQGAVFGTGGPNSTFDSHGNLFIGQSSSLVGAILEITSAGNGAHFYCSGGAGDTAFFCRVIDPAANLVEFLFGGAPVGTITTNGTTTAYNTTSDYRLKNVTGDLTTSGAFIDALSPKVGTWLSNGSAFVGLIADEVQKTSPSSVRGEKDAINADGVPIYQEMDYGSPEIIANMLAELKALRARVAALEAK